MAVIEDTSGNKDGLADLQGSPRFQRRGIPGVNSDAYHFGYLDDQMVDYRSKAPVYSRFDPLLETLYIFGALLFIVMILTGVWFGLREYFYSLKIQKRSKSSGSDWPSDLPISDSDIPGRIDNRAMLQGHVNPAYPDFHNRDKGIKHPNNTTNLPNDGTYPQIDQGKGRLDDDSDIQSHENGDTDQLFLPLEVVQNSLVYSLNSLEDLLPDHDLLKSSNLNKKIYSIREIYNLKPAEHNGGPILNRPENMSLKEAIKLSIPCVHVSFHSPWTAEKTIIEIGEALTRETILQTPIVDNATRRITILRFIAIVANSHTLKNPNIFLPNLNKTAEALIDTGEIFHLLNKTNVYSARGLIEVIIQYCYAHWIINEDNSSFIRTQFAKWKINSPMVLPHHVLARFLVNLELGSHTASTFGPDVLRDLRVRVLILLKFFFNNDHCCDFLGFFPILTQAIEFTEELSSQILFYELTHIMLERHSRCCMDDYLKEVDSELKEIVQSGFWIKNDPKVRQLAEKIHMIVLNSNPKAMSWWKEIDGGRVFLANSPREIDLICNTADIQNAQRRSAPGSWIP